VFKGNHRSKAVKSDFFLARNTPLKLHEPAPSLVTNK
jgi:hypothetical protein